MYERVIYCLMYRIYRSGGIKGLYRGLTPQLMKALPYGCMLYVPFVNYLLFFSFFFIYSV